MQLLDRRRLLTTGAAAAVLAAAGMPAVGLPKKGGLLRAALSDGRQTDTWDSRGFSGLFMIAAAQGAVFDTLTEVGPDGDLRAELATSWSADESGQFWTFDLRRDAVFHNGKPFEADDVIASLQLHLDRKSPAWPIVRQIAKIQKLSAYKIKFELRSPNADFPYLLSDYHLIIYPADDLEYAIAHGIGTGLYQVEDFAAGSHLFARRVSDHYKGKSAGWFDEIALASISSSTDRIAALADRRVDVADRAEISENGYRSICVGSNRHLSFDMVTGGTAFDNPIIRRAIKHAVNRVALMKVGNGSHLGHDCHIGPANPYFDASLDPIGYDPAKARELLLGAGASSLTVALYADEQLKSHYGQQLEMFADDLTVAGMSISNSSKNEIHLTDWSGRATEDWMYTSALDPSSVWNFSRWNDTDFQAHLLQARCDMDVNRRGAIYRSMQAKMRDDGASLIPYFMNFQASVHQRVASPSRIGNLWALDNARFAERWWMA